MLAGSHWNNFSVPQQAKRGKYTSVYFCVASSGTNIKFNSHEEFSSGLLRQRAPWEFSGPSSFSFSGLLGKQLRKKSNTSPHSGAVVLPKLLETLAQKGGSSPPSGFKVHLIPKPRGF